MNKHEATITLQDLAIGYRYGNGRKVVAEGLSLTLRSGELTCLLGANGVGKSTLLKTLCGFLPALSGEITVSGNSLRSISEKQLSQIISIVFTDKCDIHNLTVHELVALGRSPYTGFWGRLEEADHAIVSESLQLVGIAGLADRMVHTLSDGERQKVMIAKALAQQTPVIFLDEPTAFLDFPSKVEIMQLLHRLTRQTDKTIFLSTHDLELALQLADKIWLMDKSSGVMVGTPEDLSLSGHLSGFFARKGIAFDRDTGLFRIENAFRAEVQLTGHGQKFAMARKALQRNGINAGRGVVSEVVVDTGNLSNSKYVVHMPGAASREVPSIDLLLEYINAYYSTKGL